MSASNKDIISKKTDGTIEWSELEAAVNSNLLHKIVLPTLDSTNYNPTVPTDTLVQHFISGEESLLAKAMSEIEALARTLANDDNSPFKDFAKTLLNNFFAITQLPGWVLIEDYIRKHDKKDKETQSVTAQEPIRELQQKGKKLMLHLYQRVDWLLDLQHKAGKSFDSGFYLKVLASDRVYLKDINDFMKDAEGKVTEMLVKNPEKFKDYKKLQKIGVAWPHRSNVRTEIERAGFVFNPMMIKRDRCKCETCGVEVAGWRPYHNPWSFHNYAKHDATFKPQPVNTKPPVSNTILQPVVQKVETTVVQTITENNNKVDTVKQITEVKQVKENKVVEMVSNPIVAEEPKNLIPGIVQVVQPVVPILAVAVVKDEKSIQEAVNMQVWLEITENAQLFEYYSIFKEEMVSYIDACYSIHTRMVPNDTKTVGDHIATVLEKSASFIPVFGGILNGIAGATSALSDLHKRQAINKAFQFLRCAINKTSHDCTKEKFAGMLATQLTLKQKAAIQSMSLEDKSGILTTIKNKFTANDHTNEISMLASKHARKLLFAFLNGMSDTTADGRRFDYVNGCIGLILNQAIADAPQITYAPQLTSPSQVTITELPSSKATEFTSVVIEQPVVPQPVQKPYLIYYPPQAKAGAYPGQNQMVNAANTTNTAHEKPAACCVIL